MKKSFLVLCVLLLFSCSKDDDSNSTKEVCYSCEVNIQAQGSTVYKTTMPICAPANQIEELIQMMYDQYEFANTLTGENSTIRCVKK